MKDYTNGQRENTLDAETQYRINQLKFRDPHFDKSIPRNHEDERYTTINGRTYRLSSK